eukprot:1035703-Rhodomonas_salina.1
MLAAAKPRAATTNPRALMCSKVSPDDAQETWEDDQDTEKVPDAKEKRKLENDPFYRLEHFAATDGYLALYIGVPRSRCKHS